MRLSRIGKWGAALAFAGSTALFAAIPPGPGVINFVEGQVTLDGRPISNTSVGTAELQTGNVLQTTDGRVEILLSPGVFLRLSRNSEVRMVSTDLLDTRVSLDRGAALIEADELHNNSQIRIDDRGVETTLLKKGLYRFSADNPTVAVYDGKAQVAENDRKVDVKKGHELSFTAPTTKTQKFDTKKTENQDPLYAWSKLRSEYMSEASAATAQTYVVDGWGDWGGPGWFWNPYWSTYAFMPGDPFFTGPFGWGFYSPYAFMGGGFYGGGYYGGGYYGHGFYRNPGGRNFAGVRGRGPAGGFHSAPRAGGFAGGGFRGGGGGFHGGGGGGFHGGGGGGFHGGGRGR